MDRPNRKKTPRDEEVRLILENSDIDSNIDSNDDYNMDPNYIESSNDSRLDDRENGFGNAKNTMELPVEGAVPSNEGFVEEALKIGVETEEEMDLDIVTAEVAVDLLAAGGIIVHEVGVQEEEMNIEDEGGRKTVKNRWKKADPTTWKKNMVKTNRNKCLPYTTKNGLQPAKSPQQVDCTGCRFKCTQHFSEDDRNRICHEYWILDSYERKKDFLILMISCKEPARRIGRDDLKLRKNSKVYHFWNLETKVRVCQNFFLKTLNISNGPVNSAFNGIGPNGSFSNEDQRGSKPPRNKSSDDSIQQVKEHIELFPVMESHYARQSTKRKYLESNLSISKMYSLYQEKCKEENYTPVSLVTYKRVFGTQYNLSFFKPKKDQCLTCAKYETAIGQAKLNMAEEFNAHQKRKEECNASKNYDKQRANVDNTFQSATFDLQSVLQIPSSDVSSMYYSRKLCAYNLTVYEAKTPNNAYCYAWTELNGKKGSSEVGTALNTWLQQLPQHITEVSLFSDTAGGQNRNQHIASLLLFAVQHSTHLQVIEQKYLESGHTYMEVDSMHSAIESQKKHIPVYTMHDWLNIFRLARSKRGRNQTRDSYAVKELHFTDILDLHHLSKVTLKNTTKDTDGNKVNWLKVKCFRYEKEHVGHVKYRYDHHSPYKIINMYGRGRPRTAPISIQKAFTQQLPISVDKKRDLLRLCAKGAIPNEFHGWYESIPTSEAGTNIVLEVEEDED